MSSHTLGQPGPSIPPHQRRVVHGHKLPDDRPDLSFNERRWIEILRAIAGDMDTPPTLEAVQALQRLLLTR